MRVLIRNNYPLNFIFDVLYKRINYLINSNKNNINLVQDKENSQDSNKKYFVLPYIPSFYKLFNKFFKDTDINLAFFSLNKLHNIIKAHKDITPGCDNMNIVYKINCNNCDASYVGQTKRHMKTRIKEHQKNFFKVAADQSVITKHRLEYNHEFNWEDVETLDKEPFYTKRLISEMIYIKRQKNSINLHTDTENLSDIYMNLINGMSKI